MTTAFDALTSLREEWQAVQPLSEENESRLWKKLRLEWNYHSNHIEGNTLTYGETALLLLHDRTLGNHSHREYLEMKAHDVGIEHVRTLAKDNTRLLTEADIRDLNKIILKEPFWRSAETPGGQATRKEIIPGQYKTTPNNVRLANGEMFSFASVEDTPPRMSALAGELREQLEAPSLHPLAYAAKLHHDFVLIHPFDDGNGRVARLLVNYVLLRSGYLPIIVRTEDKTNYLTTLQRADAGELSVLLDYFHQLAEWSLNLGIKAAKGLPIDEPTDIEKEIALFTRNKLAEGGRSHPRTPDRVKVLLRDAIRPFYARVAQKMRSFEPLFGQSSHSTHLSADHRLFQMSELVNGRESQAAVPDHAEESFRFFGFKGDSSCPFDVTFDVRVDFAPAHYEFTCNSQTIGSYSYNHILTEQEMDQVCSGVLRVALQVITHMSADSRV